jgi:hypothetical protein
MLRVVERVAEVVNEIQTYTRLSRNSAKLAIHASYIIETSFMLSAFYSLDQNLASKPVNDSMQS